MKKIDSMNLVPFIDIMLVLLVIVLTTASFIVNSKMPIDVPQVEEGSKTENVSPLREQSITIDNGGKFYLNDVEISYDGLRMEIEKIDKGTPIGIKGDKKSELDNFVKVVETLQKNEISDIYILVKEK